MNPASLLAKLKKFDFSNWTVTLWAVHRKLVDREARYTVRWIALDQKLISKLREVMSNAVKNANQLEPYQFKTVDQDDTVFTLEGEENDFSAKILPEAQKGHEAPQIKKVEELFGAHAYVIQLTSGPNSVFGYRAIPDHWDTKKLTGTWGAFFADAKLVDASEGTIFRIDRVVDSFYYAGTQFILNKVKFERGLNFRTGMIRHRDEVIGQLAATKIIQNPDKLKELAGDNMRHLRSLASILKEPLYKDVGFIEKLRLLNEELQWGLVFTGEGLVVNDQNMQLILTLLQDKRMRSLIKERLYDAEVAKPV